MAGGDRDGPLDAGRLTGGLRGTMWTDIRIVGRDRLDQRRRAAAAAAGAAEGLVLAAESQTAGRGRLGRTWHDRPGAALTFSVLLRPDAGAASGLGLGAAAGRRGGGDARSARWPAWTPG